MIYSFHSQSYGLAERLFREGNQMHMAVSSIHPLFQGNVGRDIPQLTDIIIAFLIC